MTDEQEKRPRGRPRSIDRAEVLEAATQVFWRLGYHGASLGDLTEATGVSKPTLYAAFGDKEDLFDAVLDHYGATIGGAPVRAFQAEPDIRAAVGAFLRVAAEGHTREDRPSGCLVACCAANAAECRPALREKLRAQAEHLTNLLAERFSAEIAHGTLSAEPKPRTRALLLGDLMGGLAVRARSGASRAELLADLDARVRVVIGQ